MKHVMILTLAGALLAGPAAASDPKSELEEGFGLLGEGMELMFRGLMAEMEPAFRELEGVLSDLNAYHAPEVLPNGDIIIRRRVPLQVETAPEGEIDI